MTPSLKIREAASILLAEQALEEDELWAQLLWNAAKRMEYRAEIAEMDELMIGEAMAHAN